MFWLCMFLFGTVTIFLVVSMVVLCAWVIVLRLRMAFRHVLPGPDKGNSEDKDGKTGATPTAVNTELFNGANMLLNTTSNIMARVNEEYEMVCSNNINGWKTEKSRKELHILCNTTAYPYHILSSIQNYGTG